MVEAKQLVSRPGYGLCKSSTRMGNLLLSSYMVITGVGEIERFESARPPGVPLKAALWLAEKRKLK